MSDWSSVNQNYPGARRDVGGAVRHPVERRAAPIAATDECAVEHGVRSDRAEDDRSDVSVNVVPPS